MISEPNFIKVKNEKLERVKAIYDKNVEKINDTLYFSKDEGLEIARSLVSKMEDKEYSIVEIPVNYFMVPDESKLIKYKIVYLIEDSKREIVEKYLKNKFIFNSSQTIIKFIMDLPCNDYIQIAYYKDSDNPRIYFSRDNICELKKEPNDKIRSYISDKRYSYIIDFMDKVILEKLNDFTYRISKDHLNKLEENYINENKGKVNKLQLRQNNF